MAEFDSPWKQALDRFLVEFLAFFFPHVRDDIDWSKGYESLDKELEAIVREAELGKRLADKLFKVWRNNGEEAWVLIHIEVQTQKEDDFAWRMFVYNNRIFDRFNRLVASMAVLGDEDPDWRPTEYRNELWGTHSTLQFPIVKLIDYTNQLDALERHANPFALIVLSHLQSQLTRNDDEARLAWKIRLIKGLLDRGLQAEEIRQLFRVIDWMLELPDILSQEFWTEVHTYSEQKKMEYITSTEKYLMKKFREDGLNEGREEGREEGRLRERQQIVLDTLHDKYGVDVEQYRAKVESITDLETLRSLVPAIWKSESLDDVADLK